MEFFKKKLEIFRKTPYTVLRSLAKYFYVRAVMTSAPIQSAPAIATLAGGCFWCLEAAFTRLRGVHDVCSGYTGGHTVNPTYAEVCDGHTGHAEVVRIEFDENIITFSTLLEVFFAMHDPTTLNRQGHDMGDQYRSAIFCHGPIQHAQAQTAIAELTHAGNWPDSIVTQVTDAGVFYPAEIMHRRYFDQHPGQPYCLAVIGPKVAKLQQYFVHLVEETSSI